MSKVISRLLTFFIGFPLVIALVFCNQMNFIALKVFVFLAAILTSHELYDMIANKFELQRKSFVVFLSSLLPLSIIVCGFFEITDANCDLIFNAIFVLSILLSMAIEVIVNETFEKSISKILTTTFVVFYSSYLFTFLAKMTRFNVGAEENLVKCFFSENITVNAATLYIIFFFLVVYLNDSLAWLFGNLFGKNNKGFIKASPNKSIAGFLGGFVGSIGSGLIMFYLFPELFDCSVLKIVLLSLVMGIVAIFGDLVESVMKRSCEVKDSGTLIPGRGGVLDSVDSIIFASPVFYLAIKILYNL